MGVMAAPSKTDEWINAAEAVRLLRPAFDGSAYSAQMAICKRAHSGLVRARAKRFMVDDKAGDDYHVPKTFWHEEGHFARTPDWITGDFETWVERGEVRLRAFGVSFSRADIEKMIPASVSPVTTTAVAGPIGFRDVFIVHGHNDPAKTEVARLIEHAGLNPVILHEQPNAGRTIIEKFEAHGRSAGFAVVLLTPDDVGGPSAAELHPRARQNVIGEMFWFAGRIGRQRVCALKKGAVEIPSDFAGVTYTEMDDRGAWKQELLRELSAAGFKVDWQKALA
jgi:predicted nucleotide-binding protein